MSIICRKVDKLKHNIKYNGTYYHNIFRSISLGHLAL